MLRAEGLCQSVYVYFIVILSALLISSVLAWIFDLQHTVIN